jgi:hypothetical protein
MTAPNFVVLDASLPDVARLVTAMVQACDAGGRRSAFWSSWANPTRLARAPPSMYSACCRVPCVSAYAVTREAAMAVFAKSWPWELSTQEP